MSDGPQAAGPSRVGPSGSRRDDALALVVVALLAAGYAVAVVWRRAQANDGAINNDTYAYFYPNILYAIDSVERGWGLLWNRFQNCGQPFFAISASALLYPLHAAFLLVDPDRTLVILYGAHLLIGGLGLYALVRALGGTPWGALAGAAAFELNTLTLLLGYWEPIILAAYVWIPVALAATERLLRRPSLPGSLMLGAALTMQMLAGYPQVLFFTYQLIALRVLWECATPGAADRWRSAAAVAAALALPPLLGAVQLWPSLEMARESLRSQPLGPEELSVPAFRFTWEEFRALLRDRVGYGSFLSLTTVALAGLAWVPRTARRVVGFYTLVVVVFVMLAFENPLSALYRSLPLGAVFREPKRFLWVAAFAGCVIIGLGASAATGGRGRAGWWPLLVAPAAAAATLFVLSPAAVVGWEVLALGVLFALLVASWLPKATWLASVGLPALVIAQLWFGMAPQIYSYRRDGRALFWQRPAYQAVRDRMTLQDRLYPVFSPRPAAWVREERRAFVKSAGLFGAPSVFDYEPQASERFARLMVRLWQGQPMRSINQFYYPLKSLPRQPALLNLLAARFIVTDAELVEPMQWPRAPAFKLVWQEGTQRVYENPAALPRAFYVPQVEVMVDPAAVLERLASPTHDPRTVALVEGPEPARSGTPGGTGVVEIVEDRGESLALRVRASAPGYVFLSDQYFPGWEAAANGVPAPIRRANYAFRLVAVPAGESVLTFEYRPRAVTVGAWVSAAAWGAAGLALAWWYRRRPRASAAVAVPPFGKGGQGGILETDHSHKSPSIPLFQRGKFRVLAGAAALGLVGVVWVASRPRAAPSVPPASDSAPPNILLINLDDTRADGIDRMAAVRDRLAAEGVSFRDAFVPNANCCPSRASLLTGRYSIHHGTRTVGGVIGGADTFRESGADRQTIAVWLHERGYATGLFGKYLNEYSGAEAHKGPGGAFYVPPGWERWRAFQSSEHYGGVRGETYEIVDERGTVTVYDDHESDAQYSTDLLAVWMRAFIAEAVAAGRPFFALYAPYASHIDRGVPAPAVRHHGTLASLVPWRPPNWDEPDVADKPRWVAQRFNPGGRWLNDDIRRLAYEALLSVDEQIALTLDLLAALGVDRRTVVILTSDNGSTWGEHGWFGQRKECPYEECLRVPMIVRDPRRDRRGARAAEQPVLNIDLAPSIAELAGCAVPVPVDGLSFVPWLDAPAPPARRDFLLEHFRTKRSDGVTYAGQVADGDRLRLFHSAPTHPRGSTVFEFDNDAAVVPGAVAVPIGADAAASFANLRAAVDASVPSIRSLLLRKRDRLSTADIGPEHFGVYWWEEVDQGNVMTPAAPRPDYLGVRDVARGYTYVEYETNEVELYDLNADPWQLENKADDPRYAAVRAELAARLQELLGE